MQTLQGTPETSNQLLGEASSVDPVGARLAEVHDMPMRLVLEAAVVNFTVGTLMQLQPGDLVETAAQQNEDLMLQVNGQAVGPAKFDVSGEKLAVRLTGIA